MDVLSYLYGLDVSTIKPGLKRVENLCQKLDNPQFSYPVIHIAGTNGKGSTAAFIEKTLRDNGYKTGLYTSPHLISFNERIKVNGEDITNEELALLVEEVKDLGEASFFELTTAIAFLHFKKKNIDIAVIETGMGGKWDATNVVMPKVSVITNVSRDHMEFFGEEIEKIAEEKAGIIKKGAVICGERKPNVQEILRKKAKDQNAEFIDVWKNYILESVKTGSEQSFIVDGEKYVISLLGEHQVDNACCALATLDVLKKEGWRVDNIKQSFSSTIWRGRVQKLSENILIDGAHNVSGVKALCSFLKHFPCNILVLGISKNKEQKLMISNLAPLFKKVILTQSNFNPEKPEVLAEIARKYCGDVRVEADLKKILKEVKSLEGVVITGSLYLVGNVLEVWNEL